MDNSHNEEMIKQAKLDTEYMRQSFIAVVELKPKLVKDGNKWCYLLGADLQVGVAGFGDTPYQAMLNFNRNFGCLG